VNVKPSLSSSEARFSPAEFIFIVSLLDKHGPVPGQDEMEKLTYRFLETGHIDSFKLNEFIMEIEDQYSCKFPILTLYRSLLEGDLHYPYYGHKASLDNLENADYGAMEASSDLLSTIIAELETNNLS
jgi:acyl carrier protein